MLFKFINLLILPFLFLNTAIAAHPDFDDYDVDERVDMAAFFIGHDNNAGSFYYIVIRTTNQCFIENKAHIGGNGGGGGLTSVTCDSIKKIPEIKNYLETGKRP